MTKQQGSTENSEAGKAKDSSLMNGSQGDYASFLKNSEAERRLIDERLAEAEKGVFISAAAMHRWVESWGTNNELPPPEPDIFLKPGRS